MQLLTWTKKQEKEALAAVCTLKRTLGIPDHKENADKFIDGRMHIYTPDLKSAELIGELLYKYGSGNRKRPFQNDPEADAEGRTLRSTIQVGPVADGCYEASMVLFFSSDFVRGIRKIVDKHIAPDRRFTR